MPHRILLLTTLSLCVFASSSPASADGPVPTAVVCPKDAGFLEKLAAKEVRRYVYLRTGTMLPIVDELKGGSLIVIGAKTQPVVQKVLEGAQLATTANALGPDQYRIKTITDRSAGPILLVVGGDPLGTLYGAYRLAEHLGARFYLHGDVVPDEQIPLAVMPPIDDVGKPLFNLRGIQPFHDFPEGPDWWNADEYKAVLGQLPKLRMNFFGLHTYPQGDVGPEPGVWIGLPDDVAPDGRVKASYPARHFTTVSGYCAYRPMKTSDYLFGVASLFDRDDYGADYMRGMTPWPKTPADCNELFDRMGVLLNDSFGFARRLGIKTCVGTETPLIIPAGLKARLTAAGKNPTDPAVVQELYEGMFQRIAKAHPVDYYWLWTPESWRPASPADTSSVNDGQIQATQADFRAAIGAIEKTKAPFTLAGCGWVLGPPKSPSLFDDTFPKSTPLSCINGFVGNWPVDPMFAKINGRPKWSIPWLEDDPAMTLPQLWVGRMRRDAADSLAYGCTGLMGIHWRTRIVGPNVAALSQAAWDQRWNPEKSLEGKPAKRLQGADGGQIALFTQPIAGTNDVPLYQSVRFDVSAYRINVRNGQYKVTLKFCEPAYHEKGRRVFGVKLQGRTVVDRLDIFEKVGANRAIDYEFPATDVTHGQIEIGFVYQTEFPCIAAIVVEGPDVRKINCGGPAYKDFAADLPNVDPGGRSRYLPSADFYTDWARSEFGPEAAPALAALFAKIDCQLPRTADWTDGPGGMRPDARPWASVAPAYSFVDELAALRPQIHGAGNLERFDYWLANFRYLRAMAQVNCDWALFDAALKKALAEKDPAAGKKLARETALPLRRQLVARVAEMHRYLCGTVSTYGELGTVTNLQQHSMPGLLLQPGQELAKLLGTPLPDDAMPSKRYDGQPRLIVPIVRTILTAGEPLRLTAIVLGSAPQGGFVFWRPMGADQFVKTPLINVGRGVYSATLPAEATKGDLEYYVEATTDGKTLIWPATAPKLSQTVVVE